MSAHDGGWTRSRIHEHKRRFSGDSTRNGGAA